MIGLNFIQIDPGYSVQRFRHTPKDQKTIIINLHFFQFWREPLEDFNTIEYEINQTAKLKADNFKDEEEKEKHKVSLKVDRSLVKMRKVPGISNHFIATGGKEHDLQIWDLNQTKSGPIFRAKNVPTDSLELRVPIWVTDMCFPDNISKDKVATVSRHGHIRLYDTKGHQRRPVLSMEWPDEVLTAVSSTPCDHDILVGTATGHIAHYDIRMTHKGNFCEFLSHFFPSFFEIIDS